MTRPARRRHEFGGLVPPLCEPRPPMPGRAPRKISVLAPPQRLPLITVKVHSLICGFASMDPHPHDRALAQCRGCHLWVYLPSAGGPR
ncbi:hypothetical protein [Pseudonocardia sp. ICBG601]|uniref:hypothetical protein n=1 Tax=Pseudonocardia sp. ICBG601 TaxID=2846759 RepID=UPI001CF6F33C|nr:hypothetical protein [Pseudonocardia sp. ICBG601]